VRAVAFCLAVLALPAGHAVAERTAAPAASASIAPPPALQRVRGVISAYDPVMRSLSVTSGKTLVQVTLPQDLGIVYNQHRRVADLKQGDYIGTAAIRTADGKLRAQQVAVFPESLRGTGEGQYIIGDPASNRVMTNATVDAVTTVAPNNGTVKVTYHGDAPGPDGICTGHAGAGAGCTGTADIAIAPGVPIIALMLGDESLLVPGETVSIVASPAQGGTLEATRLTVEKDGVKPVM